MEREIIYRDPIHDKFVSEILLERDHYESFREAEKLKHRINPLIIKEKQISTISKELHQMKKDDIWKAKFGQQLLKNNPDLRHLQRELQSANLLFNVRKEQDSKSHDAHKEREKQRLQSYEREKRNREEAAAKALAEFQKKEAFRKQQLAQLNEFENRKRAVLQHKFEEQQELKDRERRIAEMEREKQYQIAQQKKHQAAEANSEIMRYQLELNKRKASLTSDSKNTFYDPVYQKILDERNAEIVRKRNDRISSRIHLANKVGQSNETNRSTEFIELTELYWHEKNVAIKQKEEAKYYKQLMQARNLFLESELHQHNQQTKRERQKQQNTAIRENTKRILEEDQKRNEREMELNRQKKRELNEFSMKLLETRRRLREADIEENKLLDARVLEYRKREDDIVTETRLRMLEKEPVEILRSLNPGVLRKTEKEHFNLLKK